MSLNLNQKYNYNNILSDRPICICFCDLSFVIYFGIYLHYCYLSVSKQYAHKFRKQVFLSVFSMSNNIFSNNYLFFISFLFKIMTKMVILCCLFVLTFLIIIMMKTRGRYILPNFGSVTLKKKVPFFSLSRKTNLQLFSQLFQQ